MRNYCHYVNLRSLIHRLIVTVLLAGIMLNVNANDNLLRGQVAYIVGDYLGAMNAWQPLAEQGNKFAQVMVNAMHERMPFTGKAAAQLCLRVAEQGYADAQHILGSMYRRGKSVPQDYKVAVHWFRRAAEQGNAAAQLSLGSMYRLGKGVPQYYVYAHMWFNIAASNGQKTSDSLRTMVEEEMTPSLIAEAQKLAHECVRKSYKDC